MNIKLAEIEKDTINRINKLKRLKDTDHKKYILLESIFSLTVINSLLIFGCTNTTLVNIENILSTLTNGLYDDGGLSFITVNDRSILALVNEDLDTKFLSEEEYFEIISLLKVASDYRTANIDDITDILDSDYGEKGHPSIVYTDLLSVAKTYMLSLGWKPTEEQYNSEFD